MIRNRAMRGLVNGLLLVVMAELLVFCAVAVLAESAVLRVGGVLMWLLPALLVALASAGGQATNRLVARAHQRGTISDEHRKRLYGASMRPQGFRRIFGPAAFRIAKGARIGLLLLVALVLLTVGVLDDSDDVGLRLAVSGGVALLAVVLLFVLSWFEALMFRERTAPSGSEASGR